MTSPSKHKITRVVVSIAGALASAVALIGLALFATRTGSPGGAAEAVGLEYRFRAHSAPVTALAFHDDGLVTACAKEGVAAHWRRDKLATSVKTPFGYNVGRMSYPILAIGTGEGEVSLCDIATPCDCYEVARGSLRITAIAISPSGRLLAAGSFDHVVRIWKLPDRVLLKSLVDVHSDRIRCLSISDDELCVAAGDDDGQVSLTRLGEPKGTTVIGAHPSMVSAVCFSRSGKSLISAGGDDFETSGMYNVVRMWSTDTGQFIQTLPLPADDHILSLATHPDGVTLAGGGHSHVFLWDTSAVKCTQVLTDQTDYALQVAFDAAGRSLACGCLDGTVCCWTLRPRGDPGKK